METIEGTVKAVRKDKKGVQLENGVWYSNKFKPETDAKPGDKVKIEYIVNGKFQNSETIEIIEKAPEEKSGWDENSRLRRITDCVLAADEDFRAGKIKKEEVHQHAKGLYETVLTIDKEN